MSVFVDHSRVMGETDGVAPLLVEVKIQLIHSKILKRITFDQKTVGPLW